MKIMISIDHPAWIHQFRHIIEREREAGNEITVLALDKDGDLELLKRFGIPYILCAHSTGKNVIEKAFLFVWTTLNHVWYGLKYKPDIFIGRGSPMLAIAAWVCRRPHLIYEDTEVSRFSLNICKKISTKILTPRTFLSDLGPRQERVDTYKELFYLHPAVFTPDAQKLRDVGFNPDEPYTVVRFVAFNASHDIGVKVMSDEEKVALTRRLQQYGRVYVSSEGPMPAELESLRLNTPYEMIHHVLAFARLVFSEGATIASEAAVLGVHSLYVNTIQSGSTKEQSERYGLLYCFHDPETRFRDAAEKAAELLETPGLPEIGQAKRRKLLEEKVDINGYFMREMERLVKAGRKSE